MQNEQKMEFVHPNEDKTSVKICKINFLFQNREKTACKEWQDRLE